MPKTPLILSSLVIFFFVACSNESKKPAASISENFNLIIFNGDTIQTGVPVPFQGELLNMDSLSKPSFTPVLHEPVITPLSSNVVPAKEPRKIPTSEILITQMPAPIPDPITIEVSEVPVGSSKLIPASPPIIKENERSSIYTLGISQGISSPVIVDAIKDSRGDFWMATYGQGFMRYNGSYFEYFTEQEGFLSNLAFTVMEDSKRNIWLASNIRFMKYDGKTLTQFSKGGVWHFKEDNKGRIWINPSDGVYVFDPESIHDNKIELFRYSTHIHRGNTFVIEDEDGGIWFNTDNQTISRLYNKTLIRYQFKNFPILHPVYSDSKGYLWFSLEGNGILKFDGDSFFHYSASGGLNIKNHLKMFEDSKGHYYFGDIEGNVSFFDGTNFTYLSNENLNIGIVKVFLEDDHGNIWIGKYTGGLNLIHKNPFQHFHKKDGIPDAPFKPHFFETKAGETWYIPTVSISYDKKSISYFPTNNQPLTQAEHFWVDTEGELWFISAYGEWIRFDREAFSKNGFIERLAPVWGGFIEDDYGHLWFYSKDLYCFNGTQVTKFNSLDLKKGTFILGNVAKDNVGNLWMSTGSGRQGIIRLKPNKEGTGGDFTRFSTKEGLANNMVWGVTSDKYENVWVATLGGLSKIEAKSTNSNHLSITNYTEEDGLSHNYNLRIVEDSLGRLWATSLNGLSVLVKDTVGNDYQIYSIKQEDGLFDPANYGALIDSKNRLWLGTTQHVSFLDLNTFELPNTIPKIRLHTIEINQNFVEYHKLKDTSYLLNHPLGQSLTGRFDSAAAFFNYPVNLTVPYKLNHLTFQYSATDWASPQKLRYSYRMVGIDENWSAYSPETKADYRNLNPGAYAFQIKAKGASLKESEIFEYSFQVLPPWWQTWWAYLSYFILLLVVIYSIVRIRTRALKKQREELRIKVNEQTHELRIAKNAAEEANEAKSTFLSTVSHELRTPLTSIIGFTKLNKKSLEDKVIPKLDPDDQKTKKAINRISDNLKIVASESTRLTNLINDLLDLAKIESGKIEWKTQVIEPANLIEQVYNATAGLFEQKPQLELLKEIPDNLPDFTADKDRLVQVLINLISNAVKFTDEGHVTIGLHHQPSNTSNQLRFYVKDTGSGIPPQHLQNVFERFKQVDDNQSGKSKGTGLGLPICKEIIEHHGGKIWVESSYGEGSTFYFTIPV